jgi:hypothetical protein
MLGGLSTGAVERSPVVGVVVFAAVGVFEEEAVLGEGVAEAGGEAPPEAGAAAVAAQVQQAGEDECAGLVGVASGDEGGHLFVGVRSEGEQADGVEVPPGAVGVGGVFVFGGGPLGVQGGVGGALAWRAVTGGLACA